MNFDEEPEGDPHGECADEIHKLQAEVELSHKSLKVFRDSLNNVAKQRDAAKEIAESEKLQNDDLKGEIVKVKTMCAEWENRALNPSQVESIWGICHNALTMHNTNEKRLAWCDNCKVHYGPWGHDKDGHDCSQFG